MTTKTHSLKKSEKKRLVAAAKTIRYYVEKRSKTIEEFAKLGILGQVEEILALIPDYDAIERAEKEAEYDRQSAENLAALEELMSNDVPCLL